MEDNKSLWDASLQLVREKLNNEQVFSTWFGDLHFESYDASQQTITIEVPHRYVYEYLEQYGMRYLSWALNNTFKGAVKVQYRIRKEPAFGDLVDQLMKGGFHPQTKCPQFSIPNARQRLEAGLKHFLGDGARWIPAYDNIVEWLSDNKGRGLLCVGTPGLGKSLICQQILPVLFGRNIPTFSAQEMNRHIDELLNEQCVIIDDLGKEPVEIKNYGNPRTPFFELCDAAEKHGRLLIITTNLSTTHDKRYQDSIENRYGQSVISRLRAIIKPIVFEGDDMRR